VAEITRTYVVVRVWDERRLIVPLQWFIENPFQNWTHTSSQLLGTTFLWLDFRTPMEDLRAELTRICQSDDRWDGRVCVVQATDTDQTTMRVRLRVSASDSGRLFDLRCAVRERMIDYLGRHHPQALPRLRMDLARDDLESSPNQASNPAQAVQRCSGPVRLAPRTRPRPDWRPCGRGRRRQRQRTRIAEATAAPASLDAGLDCGSGKRPRQTKFTPCPSEPPSCACACFCCLHAVRFRKRGLRLRTTPTDCPRSRCSIARWPPMVATSASTRATSTCPPTASGTR